MTETVYSLSRIRNCFADPKKKILSVYCTAGFPNRESLPALLRCFEEHGADMAEIGIPFSDPLADGPVIQESSARALQNGMQMDLLFEQLTDIRSCVGIPLLLMGYLNPVLQFGFEKFCAEARRCGIDGLIIPDLPVEVYEAEYRSTVESCGLDFIFLATAFTPEDRIRRMDKTGSGFLYLVSSPSVTGNTLEASEERDRYLERMAAMNLRLPRLVGFGIHNRESFESVTRHHHGAIIGTALLKALSGEGKPEDLAASFLSTFKSEAP